MLNRLRHIGISYFLLLMLMKVLAVPVIALNYLINKDFIASTLCENKARPALKCEGKCHLRKQLAKASDSGDASNQKVNSGSSIVEYCEPISGIAVNKEVPIPQTFQLYHVTALTTGFTGNVFHPPLV